VIWPDGEVNGFLYKSLGFEFDQGTQEDWKMWTTNGKQNSITVFGLTLSGDNTISVGGTSTLTLTADPSDVDLTADDIYWSTSVQVWLLLLMVLSLVFLLVSQLLPQHSVVFQQILR